MTKDIMALIRGVEAYNHIANGKHQATVYVSGRVIPPYTTDVAFSLKDDRFDDIISYTRVDEDGKVTAATILADLLVRIAAGLEKKEGEEE